MFTSCSRLLSAVCLCGILLAGCGQAALGDLPRFAELGAAIMSTYAVLALVACAAALLLTLSGMRASQKSRYDEALLQVAIHSSPTPLVILDERGSIVLVNDQVERIFRWHSAELVGQPVEVLWPLSHRERHRQLLAAASAQSARQQIVVEQDLQGLRGDGSEVPIEIRVNQAIVGGRRFLLISLVDLSARKWAEERFLATFEQAAVGIAHVSPKGHWLRVNQKLCDIVGYSREELLTKDFQSVTHPDDLKGDLESARLLLAGALKTYTTEKRYLHKEGRIVFISLTVSLVRDARGEPDYFISVIEDISRRKQAEETLRKAEAQLRQAQRMEVVGQLAGGIAHDFNNFLTPIIGYCEMGLWRVPKSEPLHEDLEQIRRAAQRAAALTRQLLAFSRKQVLQPKVVDLNALVSESSLLLRPLLGERITLLLILAPGLRRVILDPGQFEQVLLNLAVNARDAMSNGGTLTIETANVELSQDHTSRHGEGEPGPHVLLAVSDTGTGMTREVMAHLFEPFFTTKERGHGTGLGLATVHGIVKQSRGHIWAYSEVGIGTTFKLYFPASEAEESAEPPAAPEPPSQGGKETVLLVEDEEAVRVLAAKVLRERGYTVLEAESGDAALLQIQMHTAPIDLLITDVVMPGLSGREVARRIAASRAGLKVLYISGYTENSILHHGVLDRGIELLEKPFTPVSLVSRVRAILDQ